MADDRQTIPRGKYIGQRIDPRTGKPVKVAEAEHYYRCAKRGC